MNRALAAVLVAGVVVSACGAAASTGPAESTGVSSLPGSSSPSPSEPAAVSGQPTPTAETTSPPELRVGLTATVIVNRLAVREGPGTSQPFMPVRRWNDDTRTGTLVTAALRLDSGHPVLVDAGPLVLGDTLWYRVTDALDPDQPVFWDADNDGSPDAGWIAGWSNGDTYLAQDEPAPSAPPLGTYGRPIYWAIHGIGDAESSRVDFPPLDEGVWNPIGLDWYAAAPEGGGCDINLTLEPDAWGMGSGNVHAWGFGYGTSEGMELLGEKWLSVHSDCSWTLVAYARNG